MDGVGETARFTRATNSMLAASEQKLLVALAERLPPTATPDRLTAMGVLGAGLFAVTLPASEWSPILVWVALLGLALNWAGDSLDGTLARVRQIERPRYGFFVDHMSDLGAQIMIVVGLGLSPFMRFDVAMLALVGYLALSFYTMVKLQVARTMQLSYHGMGPTETRILIGAGLVLVACWDVPRLETVPGGFGLFDVVGCVLFLFAMVTVAHAFFRDARLLAVIDPARKAPVPDEVVMVPLDPPGIGAGAARTEAARAA